MMPAGEGVPPHPNTDVRVGARTPGRARASPCPRCPRSAGFTLIELLIVIAIIGTLIALLLPAVQAAREAARRMECANHLKQIGLACQNHHQAYGALPTGGYSDGFSRAMVGNVPATYLTQVWSWGYQILPFMEDVALYENPTDSVVYGTTIAPYFCPSRRSPVALTGGPWAVTNLPVAMNDYAGNGGSSLEDGDGSGIYGDGHDGVIVDRAGTPTAVPPIPPVPFVNLKNITDGTSKTLLIGEKKMNIAFCTVEPQADDNEGYVAGFQDDIVRFGAATSPYGPIVPNPDFAGPQYGVIAWIPHTFQFGSSHPGVCQFVLCDGSVQTIGFTIDPTAFQYWAVRNDGLSVQLPTE